MSVCTHSERGSIPRADEDMNKAIKYLFVDGNKGRSLVVAYEHVIKCEANVKNGITSLTTLHPE